MDEPSWITLITIACENEALRRDWDRIANELRMTVYRCGWDTRAVSKKLREIGTALDVIRQNTADMNLPPHRRFK